MMRIFFGFLSFTIVFQSLLTQAAEMKTVNASICMPRFRHEFLSLLTLEAIDQGFFQKRGLTIQPVFSGEKDREVPNDQYNRRHKEVKNLVNSNPIKIDRGVANQVGSSPETCQFGSSNVDRFLAEESAQTNTAPLMVSAYGEDYDTHLIVAKNSKIKTVADLRGKKIRVGQLPTYVATANLLAKNGVKLEEVEFERDFDSIEKVNALREGKIAALVTYLPLTAYMMATGDFRVLKANIVRDYVQPSIPHSLLIVNKDLLQKSPEVADNFKAAIMEAYTYLMRNPSDIVRILQRHALEIDGQVWNVPNAIAERAGSFVGKVFIADVSHKGDLTKRKDVFCKIKRYNSTMRAKMLFKKDIDLHGWMGIKAEESLCKESA
jgi:hypothetical protein